MGFILNPYSTSTKFLSHVRQICLTAAKKFISLLFEGSESQNKSMNAYYHYYISHVCVVYRVQIFIHCVFFNSEWIIVSTIHFHAMYYTRGILRYPPNKVDTYEIKWIRRE